MPYFDRELDEFGAVRPRAAPATPFFSGDLNNRAAYGPDVLGGNTFDTPLPEAPANASVAPSLSTPRVAGNAAAMGPPVFDARPNRLAENPGEQPAPRYDTVDVTPNGPIGSRPPDTFNTLARLDAMNARDALSQQQAYQQNTLGNQRAQASYDAATAKRNAEVSRFVAQNGADMVLAPENRGYDAQRKAIIDTAKEDAAVAAAAGGKVNAIDSAIAGQYARPYITQYAAQQEELNRAQLANKTDPAADVDLASKQLSLQQQQQLATLQQQLANETDPAKQKALQNKIAVLSGKRPEAARIAVIDVDTGQKDVMGQPIYKKAAINAETGEMVGGGTQTAAGAAGRPSPSAQSVAALRANPSLAAEFDKRYGKDAAAQYLK